jgi:hypothetical protein
MLCSYAAKNYHTINVKNCLENTDLEYYKTKESNLAYIDVLVCPKSLMVRATYDYKTKEMNYADEYADDSVCE